MRKRKILSLILALSLMLFCMGCVSGQTTDTPGTQNVELTVAAAASLTEVSKELAKAYEDAAPNTKLTFTYGASGALQTQIEQGAPVDIFLSAAQKQMDALEEQGMLLEGSRINLLENKVVLIAPADSAKDIREFEDAATDTVGKIAIGDPASVPAGEYAKKAFSSLGVWDAVNAKANLGTDVRQVLTWVGNGDVDAGVVYSTDAKTTEKVKVVAEAPEGSVDKIIYPSAGLSRTQHADAAKAFIQFLQSDAAQKCFEKYGFIMA